MADVKKRIVWRKICNKLNIFPIAIQCVFWLLSFIADSMESVQTNSELHSVDSRHKQDLHMPNANLTSYQEGMCCAGTKLFSALTCSIITLTYDI